MSVSLGKQPQIAEAHLPQTSSTLISIMCSCCTKFFCLLQAKALHHPFIIQQIKVHIALPSLHFCNAHR